MKAYSRNFGNPQDDTGCLIGFVILAIMAACPPLGIALLIIWGIIDKNRK